jgi:hypothetical protein
VKSERGAGNSLCRINVIKMMKLEKVKWETENTITAVIYEGMVEIR